MLWGIDLGGTKVEGVIIPSRTDPTPLYRYRVPTEAENGYQHVLSRVQAVVEELKKRSNSTPEKIGIGHPGVIDPHTGLVKNSNTTSLNGKPAHTDLEALLGIPVRMANDANCFTLAEATFGAARGHESVFGVILGTGVGGGVVVNGSVLYGCQGIAGEWGHNPLDDTGPLCYCGKRGCVEAIISGPRLEQFYTEQTGRRKPLLEIAAEAESALSGAAVLTIDRLVVNFGRAIGAVINILDPHIIVLGGGVSNISALYTRGVEAAKPWVFNDRLDTPILKHALGDSAGVFGAALL